MGRLSTQRALVEQQTLLQSSIQTREELLNKIENNQILTTQHQEEISTLREQLARTQTELRTTQDRIAEQSSFLKQAEHTLNQSFSTLSGQVLQKAQTQFLELAQSKFTAQKELQNSEFDKRKEAVDALVKPVAEQLIALQTSIQQLEKDRQGAYSSLTEQVKNIIQGQSGLQKETSRLVQALRTPTGRGQWGEIQLRRVVEMAGMVKYCDFTEQSHSTQDTGGRIRPDLIVNLPGGRTIIVDAKTPMDAYINAIETEDEEKKKNLLDQHAKQLRAHISQLSKKEYWNSFTTSPDFTVIFLPTESLFQAALEQDPSLIEFGVDKQIILATPTTLIALLRACAYGWQHQSLAENAQKIAAVGALLYARCGKLTEHFNDLGKSLKKSVDVYNKALGSFERNLTTSAKQLHELHVAPNAPSPLEIASITETPKIPRALMQEIKPTENA